MEILSKFGERLKELIYDNNLTVEKISEVLNGNVSTIYHWLSGKINYKPSVANLVTLADYFQCSLDFLIGLENENYLPNPKSRPLFAKWFRYAIESKGFTLYSLSRATQIGTKSFYKWINDESEPNLDSLLRISEALDCTLDYLVGRE